MQRSERPGAGYLDQFLHCRARQVCPVILGDPAALKGDKVPPTHLPPAAAAAAAAADGHAPSAAARL
eukprot:SAG22_NODE_6852_length_804_cov_0.819858_1_plen_67_part_00